LQRRQAPPARDAELPAGGRLHPRHRRVHAVPQEGLAVGVARRRAARPPVRRSDTRPPPPRPAPTTTAPPHPIPHTSLPHRPPRPRRRTTTTVPTPTISTTIRRARRSADSAAER